MSRIANDPVTIPSGVEVQIDTNKILVKGSKTSLSMSIHNGIEIKKEDNILSFSSKSSSKSDDAMAGNHPSSGKQTWSFGVNTRFLRKKLQLVGVGYRAQLQNKKN